MKIFVFLLILKFLIISLNCYIFSLAQELLATPLFSLSSASLPSQPRLKLSSGSKEALRLAVEAAARRLVEAAAELKTFRKQSKVRREAEVDTSVKRRAARSVSH